MLNVRVNSPDIFDKWAGLMKIHILMEAIQVSICCAFSVFMLNMAGQVEGLGKLPTVFLSIGTIFLTVSVCLGAVLLKRAIESFRPTEQDVDSFWNVPASTGNAREGAVSNTMMSSESGQVRQVRA